MSFHTFDADGAAKLGDPARFRFVSREKLLSHLDVAPERVVTNLGSGIGFLTDEVASHVGTLYTVDVQTVMHGYYRGKGASGNVGSVTADAVSLPFDDDHLDVAFSTMIYRESITNGALAGLVCVVRPGGTVVMVDWSTSGSGGGGPPRDERFGLDDAVSTLEVAGFTVTYGETRREAFICVARR